MMDFQKLVDSFHTSTCIVSVEKTPDGGYGEIRLVAGNKKCIETIEHPVHVIVSSMPKDFGNKFISNSLYEKYIPKNLAFEDICYRSAVQKLPMHTYIHLNNLDIWFDIFVMPLDYEEGNVCYCTYTAVPNNPEDIGIDFSRSDSTSKDVLRTCIKLHGTNDFEKTIKEIIQDIRMICKAEVCTIMTLSLTSGTCSVLATSIEENSNLKRITQFENVYDIACTWVDTIGESDCIIIKSEKDMEYIREVNYPWYLTLKEAGVDSVVMFPLRYNHEVLGFIWATNFDTDNTMRIKETLELTTFFISSEVASYKMMKRLEYISYTDLLTGLMNRNAMNSRIAKIVTGIEFQSVPFGVIFADLNGLKQVNDAQGHSAGDLLLKKSAILLQELFNQNDIYRVGGDEFVIILQNCLKEEFEQKVDNLKQCSENPENVCFAVGKYYVNSGHEIQDAMRLADENMYHNKKIYYDMHPERKHR